MGWRHIMLAAVLVTAACGSTSESSVETPTPSPGSVPANVEAAQAAVEVSADELIAAMGDEQTALAAVLLASDLGYSVGQIVPAGVAGRLQPGGLIVSPDGAPLTPDDEPSGIFDDDVTGDTSEASGFRSPPKRMSLTEFMHLVNQAFGGERGSLVVVLVLSEIGYTLEQIVLAVLAGDLANSRACLVDQNGNVIGPEGTPTKGWQGWCKATTSTTATPADTTASDTRPDHATPAASEVSDVDDTNPLSGTWVMFWRNINDSEKPAFTLRFTGSNTGTVEVLNDENETETWFELEGDVLRFGFTRTFEQSASWPPEATPFPPGGWPENSTFEGTRDSDGQFLGKWYRDDWECSPDRSPPCSYKDVRTFSAAWLERES